MAKTERGVMPNDRDSTSILRDDQDLEKWIRRVTPLIELKTKQHVSRHTDQQRQIFRRFNAVGGSPLCKSDKDADISTFDPNEFVNAPVDPPQHTTCSRAQFLQLLHGLGFVEMTTRHSDALFDRFNRGEFALSAENTGSSTARNPDHDRMSLDAFMKGVASDTIRGSVGSSTDRGFHTFSEERGLFDEHSGADLVPLANAPTGFSNPDLARRLKLKVRQASIDSGSTQYGGASDPLSANSGRTRDSLAQSSRLANQVVHSWSDAELMDALQGCLYRSSVNADGSLLPTRVERRFGSRANAQRLLQSTVLSRDVVDNLLTEMDLPLSIRQKQILWQKCGGDGGVVAGTISLNKFIDAAMPKDYTSDKWAPQATGPAAPSEFSVRKWNAIQKVKRERSKLEQQQQPPNAVATDDSSSGNIALQKLETQLTERIRSFTAQPSHQYTQVHRLVTHALDTPVPPPALGKPMIPRLAIEKLGLPPADAPTTVRRVGEGHMAGISAEQFHGLLTEFGISVDPITAQKLFERYDRNHDRRLTVHEFIASLLTDSAVASIDNGAGPMTGASAASLGRGDRTREPAYQYRMRAEQRPEPNGPSEVTPLLLLLQNKLTARSAHVEASHQELLRACRVAENVGDKASNVECGDSGSCTARTLHQTFESRFNVRLGEKQLAALATSFPARAPAAAKAGRIDYAALLDSMVCAQPTTKKTMKPRTALFSDAELAASPRAVDKLHSIYDRLPRASSIATNIAVATQPLVAASTNSLPRLVSVVDAEVNQTKSSVASAPLERSIVNASTRSTTSSANPKLKPAQFLPLFTPRGQQAVLAMAAVFKDTNVVFTPSVLTPLVPSPPAMPKSASSQQSGTSVIRQRGARSVRIPTTVTVESVETAGMVNEGYTGPLVVTTRSRLRGPL